MSVDRIRGLARPALAPVGVVGPGEISPGQGRPDASDGTGASTDSELPLAAARRFVVPFEYRSPDGTPLREMVDLRRLAREGVLRLGVDQTTILLFGGEGSPVRQVVRFRQATRTFQKMESHSPGLAREARAMLEAVSRVEVTDVRENAPPPGPMREYLRKAEIRGLLALPLRHAGEMAGFVSFEVTSRPRSWSTDERTQARAVAELMEEVLTPEVLTSVARAWKATSQPGRGSPDAGGPLPERPAEGAPFREGDRWPSPKSDPNGAAASRMPAERSPEAGPDLEAGTGEPDSTAAAVPAGESPEARREERAPRGPSTRIPRLRPLEGAALLGADLGADLLHLVEVQAATLALLNDAVQSLRGVDAEAADADPGVSGMMADLQEISQRLRRGIGSVVRMARDGRAGGELVDLNQTLASLVHRLAGMVGEGPRFVVAPASGPLPARAEPLLLERALEHLIRNARAAVAPGDRIRISWERVRMPVGGKAQDQAAGATGDPEPDAMIRIRIQDDGRGIRPDHLPWVFHPYFSASPEGDGPHGQEHLPGLGLSTVQAIVEGHGGWVDLHSRPGEGTIVDLHLPLAEDPPPAASGPDAEADPGVETEAPVILLVEDEPLLARLLDRILTRAGCRVLVASSAQEADRRWAEWGPRIRVVVVERRLAGVANPDGMVRGWVGRGDALDVVVLDRKGEAGDAPPAGIEPDAYFSRPFDPSEVARKVRRRIHRREQRDTHRPPGSLASGPEMGGPRAH